jgi:hypothetical protein
LYDGREVHVPDANLTTGWKKFAIRSLFIGIGLGIGFSIAIGSVIWYKSRPVPPKPWNASAIVVSGGPPSFWTGETGEASDDDKNRIPILLLDFMLENKTDTDYSIKNKSDVKFVSRFARGGIGHDQFDPDNGNKAGMYLPLFIPARDKADFQCYVADRDLPTKESTESDSVFHERLRAYLEKSYGIEGWIIFDELNHYQIDLPKWSDKPIKQP